MSTSPELRTVSPEFEFATIEVEKVDRPVDDPQEKVPLYGWYKVAYNYDFENAEKPGGLMSYRGDFFKHGAAKAKYNEWKKDIDAKITPEEAEKKYIQRVEDFKEKYGFDPKRTTLADGKPIDKKKLERFDELAKQLGRYQ